ncbi:MAG: potassium-transporting ATPase subunit KdpA [Hydrogenophilaceae bacterium]|jgi:K+-transporting ATPase ATPase A chain|nr:potassium-transporting ATPase subunit KdpA [Hydrogenophilaceae bacterium]
MTLEGWTLILAFIALVAAIARPLGLYLDAVFAGRRTLLSLVLRPVENTFYRLAGVKADVEQDWKAYALAVLLFSFICTLALYALLRLQGALPLNPQAFGAVAPNVAMNTAVSFVTNTNWQAYAGESTMSHLTQMLGLTVQNFLSAAVGIAVAIAFARGFARRGAATIGNFWVDMTRATLYVLLPISTILAIAFIALGMPQTLAGSLQATTLEGAHQDIAIGPVASQIAIKMLGTNGGGFFNANAAHPFENMGPIVNLIQMLSIFAIGAGLTITFGRMVGDERQGWALLAAMGVLFLFGTGVAYWAEAQATPALIQAGVDPSTMNMEGKETRFGIAASALFAAVTTAASCGAVNAMHDSFSALGGMVPLTNILAGEVIVGGVGAGLYGILVFAILTIFVAGLMVGRTPAYLGKKIEARDVKLAVLAILASPLAILIGTALAAGTDLGRAGVQDPGPHGFTEMLYAFASAAGNNGSAFGGLTATSDFYTYAQAAAMLIGRFLVIVPALAIAGNLAAKPVTPASSGSFPTTGLLFIGLLAFIIVIVGALTFFPALALGPLAEATAGRLF